MFQLPLAILLGLSVVGSTGMMIFRGVYSKKYPMKGVPLWRFQLLQNLFCTAAIALIYLISGADFSFSLFSVMIGVCFAIITIVAVITTMKAQEVGPFSYTTVIICLSAVIPALSGVLFFHEKVSLVQYLGVAMMVLCIILSPDTSNETGKKANLRWLLLTLAGFLFSGFLGLGQKIHQSSELHSSEMPALLLTCFVLSTVASFVGYVLERRKAKKQELELTCTAAEILYPALTGVCFSLPHALNLFLSGKVPSVIMFPLANLLPLMLVMLYAVVFMKERLSLRRWLGIAVGVLSAILVSGLLG